MFMKTLVLFCALCAPAFVSLSSTTCSAQVQGEKLTAGSKVFIEPMGGFETYLAAALVKKKVPVLVVDDKSKADFILSGNSRTEEAGWAKTMFVSNRPHSTASISIKDIKNGVMLYAYNVDKSNAARGDQSTAEACAKHLKEFIEKGK